MRDGRTNSETLLVDLLRTRLSARSRAREISETHPQLLVVLGLAVHLNLESVDLELQGALGAVDIGAVVGGGARGVELFDDLREGSQLVNCKLREGNPP